MNDRQRVFLVQARSDFEIFEFLVNKPECHRLHYIQMCTEKLAKAYFWKTTGTGAGDLGHKAFLNFVRRIVSDANLSERLRQELGFGRKNMFDQWIRSVSDLARQLEHLAPALAGDAQNPEYPWPRYDPSFAPVEAKFSISKELFKDRKGIELLRMVRIILDKFDVWN